MEGLFTRVRTNRHLPHLTAKNIPSHHEPFLHPPSPSAHLRPAVHRHPNQQPRTTVTPTLWPKRTITTPSPIPRCCCAKKNSQPVQPESRRPNVSGDLRDGGCQSPVPRAWNEPPMTGMGPFPLSRVNCRLPSPPRPVTAQRARARSNPFPPSLCFSSRL